MSRDETDEDLYKALIIDNLGVNQGMVLENMENYLNYRSHKSFDYFVKKYQLKMEDRYIIYTKDLKMEAYDCLLYPPVT